MKWTHDELMHDLAEHLASIPDNMIWTDMKLGPFNSQRPDVFCLKKSYTNPRPMTYEIKVSVSDFRSDVTSGKWMGYLDFSAGVYFCVPKGLITKNDIPQHAGLMVRGEKGWRSLKKPTLNECEVPWSSMQKLLIDGIRRERQIKALSYQRDRIYWEKIRKQVAKDIADAAQDFAAVREDISRKEQMIEHKKECAERDIERAKEKADEELSVLKSKAVPIWYELCRVLSIPEDSSSWQVDRAIMKLKEQLHKDECFAEVKRCIERANCDLSNAFKLLGVGND